MSAPLTKAQIQAIFAASPFIAASGMEVVAAEPERQRVTVRMAMRPEFERAGGSGQWHGGPIASLIDTAGDAALILTLGGGVPTINFRTDYLRPASDTALTATATVRRAGRTVGVVDVDVSDDQGRLVAVGRGTYSTQVG